MSNFIEEFEKEIKINNVDIAISLNDDKSVKGIISIGDLRRLIENKVKLNERISKFLNKSPIVVKEKDFNNGLYSKILKEKEKISKNLKITNVIVVDNKRKFKRILNFKEIESNFNYKKICIIGLGHIGLPLAVHLLKGEELLVWIKTRKFLNYQNTNLIFMRKTYMTIYYLILKIKNYKYHQTSTILAQKYI